MCFGKMSVVPCCKEVMKPGDHLGDCCSNSSETRREMGRRANCCLSGKCSSRIGWVQSSRLKNETNKQTTTTTKQKEREQREKISRKHGMLLGG